ncbi:MAG: cupin domain-containing protein [Bdellovibrionota bacterium]
MGAYWGGFKTFSEAVQAGYDFLNSFQGFAAEDLLKEDGFHAEILPPGQFSCPYHFHHSEEELFLVLEGKAMLRQANRFREVSKGDLIFFTNSSDGAHQFYNHSHQPFRFLALSTMDDFEVCEYPDSKKINVTKIKKVFQGGTDVDYLKDEENPSRFWPKEHLRN